MTREVERETDMPVELGKWREMLMSSGALDEERARRFSSTMSEVLINSFTHGKTRSACIIAGQTFPTRGHSVLATVDHGLTIPATLEACGRYGSGLKPEAWVLKSLERGVTCKSRPSNMGYGLFLLSEMIQKNGGSMTIVSGAGVVSIRQGSEPVAEPLGPHYDPVDGTFIVLDIRSEGSG